MLKFFNSRYRNLTQPLRISTPFTSPPVITFFSHLHSLDETSKIASLLSGLELDQEEDRKQELRSSSTTSFHGQKDTIHSEGGVRRETELGGGLLGSLSGDGAVQIAHPWPEWVSLMELLLKRGYFDEIGNPFGNEEMGIGAKDSNLVRTACLNFGRDRVDLIRHISRKDISATVEFGCPSLDRKVVNSGKRLRAYVSIDEANICSSCSLRGNCDRAYVKAREEEVARTVDVMRILLTFGLDHTTASVENDESQNKSAKESVRSILRGIVGLSQEELDTVGKRDTSDRKSLREDQQGHIKVPMKQGDWICPKCNFMNFARNVKCFRCNELFEDRVRKMIEDQQQLPLKKGDWLCEKCNFLNFAKNPKCKLCQVKPPKRTLDTGEWQCDSCHYINFRKNTICLRCDHRRPKASASSNPSPELNDCQDGPKSCVETQEGERRQQNSWQFVVDENNKDKTMLSKKNVLEFMDFPIIGGTSALSRSEEEIEKWKEKMRERSKCMRKAEQKGNGLGFAVTKRPKFLECTDNEDMDEWFGEVKD